MVGNTEKNRKKVHPCNYENCALEKIFQVKPSLGMDVMDFLLIAGWYYSNSKSPLYRRLNKEMQCLVDNYIMDRRNKLSVNEKNLEKRFLYSVYIYGGYYEKKLKTLRELKTIFEKEGMGRFKGMHYKTLAHFNETLKEYRIKPFKLGGRHYGEQEFTKYGLELVNK